MSELLSIAISAIVNLLEKAGLAWWSKHKSNEATNVAEKDMSLGSADAQSKLREWTRPE